MKYYHPILGGNTVYDPLVCDTLESRKGDNVFGTSYHSIRDFFFSGKPVDHWPDDVFFTASEEEDDGVPDDELQNIFMTPVFSERLVNAIIEQKIEGFQFLPVSVYGYNMSNKATYYIANCLNLIAALDFDKSVYHQFPDDFINPAARGEIVCQKFVLKSEKVKKYDVFRLEEQESALFVSDKFVKMFKKNKFTGYSFDPVKLV